MQNSSVLCWCLECSGSQGPALVRTCDLFPTLSHLGSVSFLKKQKNKNQLHLLLLCVYGVRIVPRCTYRGQRTTLWNWSSPSTSACILGLNSGHQEAVKTAVPALLACAHLFSVALYLKAQVCVQGAQGCRFFPCWVTEFMVQSKWVSTPVCESAPQGCVNTTGHWVCGFTCVC